MKTFLNLFLILLTTTAIATAAPVNFPDIERGIIHDWRPLSSGLVSIKLDGPDGKTYEVVYSSKLVPCDEAREEESAEYVCLTVPGVPGETPDGCYLVFKGPVGYLENGQFVSLFQKTWPIK